MEGIVLNTFRDKYTEKIFNTGDSYEHEDANRVAFLVEKGFLEIADIEITTAKLVAGGEVIFSHKSVKKKADKDAI